MFIGPKPIVWTRTRELDSDFPLQAVQPYHDLLSLEDYLANWYSLLAPQTSSPSAVQLAVA